MTEETARPAEEIIKILVRANSSKNIIEGLFNNRIKIRIACAPEKGKANKALLDYISLKTGIPKTYIKIISGEKSCFKTISIKNTGNRCVRDLLLNV